MESNQKLSAGLLRISVNRGRGKKAKQLLGLGAWKCTEWDFGKLADMEVEVIYTG